MDQSVSVVASPLQHPAGYQSQTQQQQLFVLAYVDEVVFDWSRSLLICWQLDSMPSSYDLSSTTSAVSTTFNSSPCQAFLTWKQQDQLILSALLSSLSVEVLHPLVDCPTSANVWSTLKLALTSPSNSRIMQLHSSLQDLWQGDDTVTLYLQRAKGLFDELVVVSRLISLTNFNLYVFRGLRGEFCDLVTSLSTKANPLSYSELHSHLSTHEFIHRSSLPSSLPTAPLLPTPAQPPLVYVAQCGFSGSNSSGFTTRRGKGWRSGWQHPRNNFPQPNGQFFRGAGGGSPW